MLNQVQPLGMAMVWQSEMRKEVSHRSESGEKGAGDRPLANRAVPTFSDTTYKAVTADMRRPRRRIHSAEDRDAAARILSTEPERSDLRKAFDRHVQDLIAEGRRVGVSVEIKIDPMTQWNAIATEEELTASGRYWDRKVITLINRNLEGLLRP